MRSRPLALCSLSAAPALLLLAFASGCSDGNATSRPQGQNPAPSSPPPAGTAQDAAHGTAPAVQRAICRILGTEGHAQVKGVVRFEQVAGGVRVHAEVEGLKPGKHGFHVHESGDITCADGMCCAGHFDTAGRPHGAPDDEQRHVGDLGNLDAGEDGKANYERTDRMIALSGVNSIIGRSIIIHADPDDLKSQPTGNAGGRIGYGVIGIDATPAKK